MNSVVESNSQKDAVIVIHGSINESKLPVLTILRRSIVAGVRCALRDQQRAVSICFRQMLYEPVQRRGRSKLSSNMSFDSVSCRRCWHKQRRKSKPDSRNSNLARSLEPACQWMSSV